MYIHKIQKEQVVAAIRDLANTIENSEEILDFKYNVEYGISYIPLRIGLKRAFYNGKVAISIEIELQRTPEELNENITMPLKEIDNVCND